jgi:hypothetical protein
VAATGFSAKTCAATKAEEKKADERSSSISATFISQELDFMVDKDNRSNTLRSEWAYMPAYHTWLGLASAIQR